MPALAAMTMIANQEHDEGSSSKMKMTRFVQVF
jgi:hypothetical protein